MKSSNWLFCPLKIENSSKLQRGATRYSSEESKISKSSPFSVYLRGIHIGKSEDNESWKFYQRKPSKTNDLLVLCNFQAGTSPTVQRFHYFKEKQKIKEHIENLFNTLVCSYSDFKDSHITLQIQAFDVDSYEPIKQIFSGITQIAGNTAVTFPIIAPYLPGVSAASSLVELLDRLDKHDLIMESNLRLEITEQDTGSQLLQAGHWVYFDKPSEEALELDSNLHIKGDFADSNYAIFSIKKEEAQEPQWELSQKIATLLSELNGKGSSGKAAIEFLRETMDGYAKYKKITRYQELSNKYELFKATTTNSEKLGMEKTQAEKEARKIFSVEEENQIKKLEEDESIKNFITKKYL